MSEILELVRAHGIDIIEHYAQAHGARIQDKILTTAGNAARWPPIAPTPGEAMRSVVARAWR